jgi:hypothetical protein
MSDSMESKQRSSGGLLLWLTRRTTFLISVRMGGFRWTMSRLNLGECPALRRVSPRSYGVRFAPVLRTGCAALAALRIAFRVTPDNQQLPATMKHKLKNHHVAYCKDKQELRMAIAACEKAGAPVHGTSKTGGNDIRYPHISFVLNEVYQWNGRNPEDEIIIPLSEFIARAMGIEPQSIEPTIVIDGRTLEFLDGGAVKVGCQTIDAATIDLIHERSKAKRK